MTLLAAYTTVASREEAQHIASALVERRLAACVQIEAIDSVYRWRGVVQHEAEFRLMFKTTAAAYPALEAALLELHPYTLPAVHALAVAEASAAYAAWVAESVDCG